MKPKRKIGRTPDARVEQSPIVVVFGSQRIGAIYALRNSIDPGTIRLATGGAEVAVFLSSPVTVVRVSEEVWKPPTHPCEVRTRETEQALKAFEQGGGKIENVVLA